MQCLVLGVFLEEEVNIRILCLCWQCWPIPHSDPHRTETACHPSVLASPKSNLDYSWYLRNCSTGDHFHMVSSTRKPRGGVVSGFVKGLNVCETQPSFSMRKRDSLLFSKQDAQGVSQPGQRLQCPSSCTQHKWVRELGRSFWKQHCSWLFLTWSGDPELYKDPQKSKSKNKSIQELNRRGLKK